VNPNTVSVLLIAFAAYMLLKTATAPKRGTFLTALGNIRRDAQPRAFTACLIGGYALAVTAVMAAIFRDFWLPVLSGL
jgi:hypothetical protein